jgi:CRISPR-associated exonuclease Cas4
MWMIWIALGLLAVSITIWVISRGQQAQAGLPSGKVVFIDTTHLRRPEGALFSANYSLTGRPDFLVNQNGKIIPIEVKSVNAPVVPYPSHIYQLGAYGLLIKEHFGELPPRGILKYRDRAIEIPFTPDLMGQVIKMLEEIRTASETDGIDRSHSEKSRCRSCGFRSACGQSLV